MLSKYETVLIVKPDLPEDQFENVKSRAIAAITTMGGHEILFQDWGKKRLAYPIKKSPKGNYLYFRYLSEGKGVVELERNMKVLEPMLRFLTVKLGDRIDEEAFDFEGEASTIFPFGVKPREPVVEAPKPDAEAATEGEAKAEPEAAAEAKAEPKEEAAAEAVEEKPAEKPVEKAEEKPAEKPAAEKPAAEKPAAEKPVEKAEEKAEKAPVEAVETKKDAAPEPEAAKAEGEAEAATTEEKAE